MDNACCYTSDNTAYGIEVMGSIIKKRDKLVDLKRTQTRNWEIP